MRTLLTFLLALPFTVLGQPAGTIAGFGYRNAPQAMEAAPGQVIIVSIHGAKARLDHPIYGSPQRQSTPRLSCSPPPSPDSRPISSTRKDEHPPESMV